MGLRTGDHFRHAGRIQHSALLVEALQSKRRGLQGSTKPCQCHTWEHQCAGEGFENLLWGRTAVFSRLRALSAACTPGNARMPRKKYFFYIYTPQYRVVTDQKTGSSVFSRLELQIFCSARVKIRRRGEKKNHIKKNAFTDSGESISKPHISKSKYGWGSRATQGSPWRKSLPSGSLGFILAVLTVQQRPLGPCWCAHHLGLDSAQAGSCCKSTTVLCSIRAYL